MKSYVSLENVAVNYPIFDVKSRSLKANFIRLTTGGKVSS
ncbi:sugar ABC transporter ATP-binding protein, partial [Escherichia coli]|nr:sugar ABC transporter ATP-binding protein [Escherichia coli]